MTVQPTYITFHKNVATALAGGKVDTSNSVSSSAIFFQMLMQKSEGLKKALGLLADVQSTPSLQKTPLPYENYADFSSLESKITNDFARPYLEDINPFLTNPNLVAAQVFIDGLEESFADWLLASERGGIADPTEGEKAVTQQFQNQLQTLKQYFKKGTTTTPTDEQYSQLYALPRSFVAAMEELIGMDAPPRGKIVNFWMDMMIIYNSMTSLADPASNELNTQISDYNLLIDQANATINTMRNIITSIKNLCNPVWSMVSYEAPGWTDADYNAMEGDLISTLLTLCEQYRSLLQNYPTEEDQSLPTEIRDAVKKFVDKMQTIQIRNAGTDKVLYLNYLMATAYCYLACQYQYGVSSSSSISDYNQALASERNFWYSRETGPNMKKGFELYNQIGTPQTPTYSDLLAKIIIFLDSAATKFNPLFFQESIDKVIRNDRGTFASRENMQRFLDEMETNITSIEAQISAWSVKIAELLTKKTEIEVSNRNYYTVMNEDKATFVSSSPIQSVYASLMLDKYLPNQQFVLETLGSEMTFSNKAAKYLNEIIRNVAHFQTADVYYCLGIYIKQMNLQAYDEVDKKVDAFRAKELACCNADLKRSQAALTKIEEILEEIKEDEELSSSQQKELQTIIGGFAPQFRALIRNLSSLKTFLSGMRIVTVPDKEKDSKIEAFTVTVHEKPSNSWLSVLADLESFVIDGGDNASVYGGEKQIAQSLESYLQDYITFNQNQQLALQLEGAAIQQEWTIVAASLALMNSIFAKLIRRFKS